LYFLPRLVAFSRKLGCLALAVPDVTDFFFHDLRQDAPQGFVRTATKFFQLVATHAIDEKPEDSKILPRLDDSSESIEIAFLIGPAENKRDVNTHVAPDTGDLAVVIHLLGGGALLHHLTQFAGGRRQVVFYIEMGAADLAIRLYGNDPS